VKFRANAMEIAWPESHTASPAYIAQSDGS
jgi:hypothetical protein